MREGGGGRVGGWGGREEEETRSVGRSESELTGTKASVRGRGARRKRTMGETRKEITAVDSWQ
jgi:hypothetical protein